MRATSGRRRTAAIAIGGVVGAGLRWALLASVDAGRFPWPVFLVNVLGSIALGALLAEEVARPSARLLLHDAGAIGFCGGLTTFSTFSIEIVELLRSGDVLTGAAYAVGSVVAGVAGVVAGAALRRRVRAVTLPVEEVP